MMQKHVLLAHHFEKVGASWQERIARRLERAVPEFRECVVTDERHQVRHRERTVDAVEVRFAEIEKLEQ